MFSLDSGLILRRANMMILGISVPTDVRALQHPGRILSCALKPTLETVTASYPAKACPHQWEIEKGVLPSWPYTASCLAASPGTC